MQKSEFELQGIQFPASIREEGASVEILQLDAKRSSPTLDLEDWISENSNSKSENSWRIISHAKSREESMLLVLSEKKAVRTRYREQSGRLTKSQEQVTELEIGEIHLRKSGLVELYSVPPKQRKGLLTSLAEFFQTDEASTLALEKDAMMELIGEATEVTSVSLTGIGNPFFSDVTLSGQDPVNSRTFKELLPSASIKSFRAKLQSGSSDSVAKNEDSGIIFVAVGQNCRVRFYAGRHPVPQGEIEDYLTRIRKIAKISNTLVEK